LFTFSDIGRKLENLVYIELKRRWNEIYYHKNRKECDFIVWGQKRDLRSEEGFEAGREMLKESFENKWWEKVFLSLNWDLLPIQVTYSLEDEQTKEREIAWLVEAMKMYWLKEGLILTYDEENEIHLKNDLKIKIMPVWKWLLKENY
jgi:predicted AAA+ superfamily ATPase